MKRKFLLLGICSLLISCSNQEVEFDDFANQRIYFPFQTPVRTIILGDEAEGDNSIDRDHAFSVGVAIGGMYYNDRDREVGIELAPGLAENITNAEGDTLYILPAAYYNATFDRITIPEGSFFGKLRVDLEDAFFEDPAAVDLKYVLPLRINDGVGDTVLSGVASSIIEDPDPRIGEHWVTPPKNYTLFGVQYINPLHGVYLLRGRTINTTAVPQDTVVYSTRFLTDNDITKLTTRSLTENIMSTLGGVNKDGKYQMLLSFDEESQNITVSRLNETSVVVSGTGKFYTKEDEEAESYSEYRHRTIYLDYTYEDGGNTFHAMDSMVFIDTDVTFETFQVVVMDAK
jgi:hypothetical protein